MTPQHRPSGTRRAVVTANPPLRILSLGAGVQSSTLLLMACQGELEIDAAIFADTQWEPAAVYRHLEWLEGEAAKAGIAVHRVTQGNLREDAMNAVVSAWMPLYLRNNDGGKGMLRRQCTRNYKIDPIRRQVRALGGGRKRHVRLHIGISLDEVQRMRDSDVKYITNVYPLVARRMTRHDCVQWLERNGYPKPVKSACIGCPYHDSATWRTMKIEQPADFANAVEFDAAIRNRRHEHAEAFLHRSLIPLDQIDFSDARDHGQQDLFSEECEGMCGV